MIIAVWVKWQCAVIRGRLQGLVADRIRRSKVEEQDSSVRKGCTIRKHSNTNSIVAAAAAVSKLQREQRGRGLYVFNQWKSNDILLFSFFLLNLH